jgi:hypothetical protein
MEKYFDRSVYQDKEKLSQHLNNKTVRQLANEWHVSYKLINTWAIQHNLIKKTDETKTV